MKVGVIVIVKIKVSYECPADLALVIRCLGSLVRSCKIPKQQSGLYKKAYIELKQ